VNDMTQTFPQDADGRARVTLADDIRTVWRAFTYRWKMIVLVVLVFGGLGLGYMWTATPGYESSVEILVDPRERDLVDGEVAKTGLGSSSYGADASLVESQVGIITSSSVLGRLIEEFNLENDSEFGLNSASLTGTISSAIKAIVYGPNFSNYDSQTPFDRALEKLYGAIAIERVGNTYIMRIAVTTEDPVKSAKLADGIARIYLAEGQGASNSSSEEAAVALEARLDELRIEAEAARQAVEDYRVANRLLGADNLMLDEAQLRDLNDQVTQARIATESARNWLEEVTRVGDAPATATLSGNTLSSGLVEQLRTQLDLAVAEEQSLSATMGPRHPTLGKARERRQALEASLAAEFGRIEGSAESGYQSSLANQQKLEAMLAEYEGRQAEANTASVRLNDLQRVADTKTGVYQSFLTRAIEARQQIELPTSTARIISPASISSRPSEPRLMIVIAVSLFLGVVLASGIAWLQHVLLGTPAASATTAGPRPDGTRRPRRPFLPAWKLPQREPRPEPVKAAAATPSASAVAPPAAAPSVQPTPVVRPPAAERAAKAASNAIDLSMAANSNPASSPRDVVTTRRLVRRVPKLATRPTIMQRVLAELLR
jgi:polysaccharide biosynthesis transport protein